MKSRFWDLLSLVSSLFLVWTAAKFTSKSIMAVRFSNTLVGEALSWGVLPLEENDNHICVDYSFYLKGEKFHSQYMYKNTSFDSEVSANNEMDKIKSDRVKVWYWEKSEGEPISILEPIVPLFEFFYMVLAFVVVLSLSLFRKYKADYKRS